MHSSSAPCWEHGGRQSWVPPTAAALSALPLPLVLLQPSMSRVVIVTGGKSPELQGEAQGMQTKLNREEWNKRLTG